MSSQIVLGGSLRGSFRRWRILLRFFKGLFHTFPKALGKNFLHIANFSL
jgi:hypothetical protein